MQDRKDLFMFGFCLLVVLILGLFNDIYMNSQLADWHDCVFEAVEQGGSRKVLINNIMECKFGITEFPIYYSIWAVQIMAYNLAILLFKKSEDYIARYS